MEMIERYENPGIAAIWCDRNKLKLWRDTELAVIHAKEKLGRIPRGMFRRIKKILLANLIDLVQWKEKEKELKHDLNAFIFECLRWLPPALQVFFHQKMTSYDTEEPAFAQMLADSIAIVDEKISELMRTLIQMAKKYRYTIMNGRTHDQEAELQSFGKRCLTWLQALRVDLDNLSRAVKNLKYSKLSGAIGSYGSIDPEVEKEALRLLGLKPFYGATQIMPRELYAPIAQALAQIAMTLEKIALDIRLGARSGRPIYQEPFGKKQTGSSAMPHKKNTITTEQVEGMARMAQGYLAMIMQNIATWEERAIEQSCVERVAWPDLFHVVVHSLSSMNRILSGLKVYPDNMMLEVIDSRGCYAAGEAKEVLRELGAPCGLDTETAYRVAQLAAFNVFEPEDRWAKLRETIAESLAMADALLHEFQQISRSKVISIQKIIPQGALRVSPQLAAGEADVQGWNEILKQIFSDGENLDIWNEIFDPSYLLKGEDKLFAEILGEAA